MYGKMVNMEKEDNTNDHNSIHFHEKKKKKMNISVLYS